MYQNNTNVYGNTIIASDVKYVNEKQKSNEIKSSIEAYKRELNILYALKIKTKAQVKVAKLITKRRSNRTS